MSLFSPVRKIINFGLEGAVRVRRARCVGSLDLKTGDVCRPCGRACPLYVTFTLLAQLMRSRFMFYQIVVSAVPVTPLPHPPGHNIITPSGHRVPSTSTGPRRQPTLLLMTSPDPYQLLGVPRAATPDQIRRAYKRACLRHHPDKHPAGAPRVEAERVFKLIAHAYTKLTDAASSPPHSAKTPPSPSPDPSPCPSSPTPPAPPPDTSSSSSSSSSSFCNGDSHKPPDREVDLPLTLEELHRGCVKRRKLRVQGTRDDALPVLTIAIKPGYRPGDRIRFRDAWTPPSAARAVDVVFILSQRAHSTFTLDGDDLKLTMRLNLVDALTGALLLVKTLDDQPLNLLLEPVISPSHVERVPGHGMPRRANPSTKGDLLVAFDIAFPTAIDAQHRPAIRELFSKLQNAPTTSHAAGVNGTSANNKHIKRHIRRSSSVFLNNSTSTNPGPCQDPNATPHATCADEAKGNKQGTATTQGCGLTGPKLHPHQSTHSSTGANSTTPHATASNNSNNKFSQNRRASTTHDASSEYSSSRGVSERRDEIVSQHSSQPQSKSRRRFVNIFR